jgi:hypothetical protein
MRNGIPGCSHYVFIFHVYNLNNTLYRRFEVFILTEVGRAIVSICIGQALDALSTQTQYGSCAATDKLWKIVYC